MGLTAFLPTGAPQILPFIGTPRAATVGYALVWSESPQGFNLAPISVGPESFSGVLPISKGGTGTATGSITGPGALTFTAGGSNQNITLSPSGSGGVRIPSTAQSSSTTTGALAVSGDVGIQGRLYLGDTFSVISSTQHGYLMRGFGPDGGYSAVGIAIHSGLSEVTDYLWIANNGISQGWGGIDNHIMFASSTNSANFPAKNIWISANNNLTPSNPGILIEANTNRVGVAKTNPAYTLDINGSLRASASSVNFANLPTSDSNLTVGDLWRDGNTVKVKI